MLPEYFAIIGSAIAAVGSLYYLYCTIKGTVKPNRVTWFFWAAFPLIAFAAQLAEGVGLIAWVTFVSGFMPLLIFVAAVLNPAAYWKVTKLDYLFAGIGVLSIVLWYITKDPIIALTFALVADFAVSVPTMIKIYKYPETETWEFYGLNAVGFGLALLAIQVWTYENYVFLIFLFLMNVFFTFLARRKPSEVIDI